MYILLVCVIYLAFISLGLPDSLLGSAWPTMHIEVNASLSMVGIVSFIITVNTIISSLLSDKLNNKFGTHFVVSFSILLTAIALYLFSIADSFWQLCLIAIPYGLGAGSIDASLNNYVALNLKASHMSWLHCMWGIGATISPMIMSYSLTNLGSYKMGYKLVAVIQIIITIIVLISKPLWKRSNTQNTQEEDKQESISIISVFKLNGASSMLFAFLCYCAIEGINFVYTSSYFAEGFKIDVEKAALLGSLFYSGMMIGRAISGFVAEKLGDQKLIKIGTYILITISIIMFILNNYYVSIVGFIIAGIGAGPIYPSLIHETPNSFDRKYTQSIIGVQMATAYTGSAFSPYLFGLLSEHINIKLLPLIELILSVIILILINDFHKKTKDLK